MNMFRYAAGGVFTGIVLAAIHCSPGDGRHETAGEAVASATAADTAPCASPRCDTQRRKCEFTDGTPAGTLCGVCVSGTFANAAGVCEPVHTCSDPSNPCPHQQCADQNGTGPAVCLAVCDTGYVLDSVTGKCRAVKTCGGATPLTCAGGAQCVDSTTSDGASGVWVPAPGQDAVCECLPGQGLDPATGQCTSCGAGDSTQCAAAPGTSSGRVIYIGGGCGCEVPDNYFMSLGNTPTPCDADGDGWVTAKAEPIVEEASTPALYRAFARCHVRRVSWIVLHADDGTALPAQDVTAKTGDNSLGVPVGLPLYEDESLDDPTVTTRPYVGPVVNGLTKACVLGPTNDSTQSDFNSNGVLDAHEGLGSDVLTALAARNLTDKMKQYYKTYLQYSYFLELHNAWYTEDSSSGAVVGTYHIAERRRIDAPSSGSTGVGVAMVDTALADTGSYWKECPRQPDVLAAANLKLPGYDFASAGAMNHHSQFKCVDLVDAMNEYGATTEATAPEVVGITTVPNGDNTTYGWALMRRDVNGGVQSYNNWSVKTCSPTGTIPPADTLSHTNPSYAAIQCADGFGSAYPTTSPPPRDQARWVVVDGIQADGANAAYDRGCVNLCDSPQKGGCTGVTVCLHAPTPARPAPNGYPSCGCPPDYNGDGITTACTCPLGTTQGSDPSHCVDIDECVSTYSPKWCSSPQYCHNLTASKTQPNRAECDNCNPGYRSNGGNESGSCGPIDVCADRNPSAQCSASEYCQYAGPGARNCGICPVGVASDGFTCNGPQECYNGYCSNRPNSHCAEYSWGWNCDCNAGYDWNGSACAPPDPCAGVRCQAHAHCSGGDCYCTLPYVDDGDGICMKQGCPCGGIPGHCKLCGRLSTPLSEGSDPAESSAQE